MTPQFIGAQIKYWNAKAKAALDAKDQKTYVQAYRAAIAYRYIRELQHKINHIDIQLRKLLS